ncbi:probable transcription factor PosF21 [Typha latifolia]|uniref:probable transcription factor PosF21 n=1 Tax=Typha latifolia TaxID=4733 RepID=UPI003C30122A
MDETALDCHGQGTNRVPHLPTKISNHRRAESETISLSLNDINSISDFRVLDNDDDDDELLSMLEDLENFDSSFEELSQLFKGEPSKPPSMDATATPPPPPPPPHPHPHSQEVSLALSCDERLKLRRRHKYSQSLDGSFLLNSELLTLSTGGPSSTEKKKAISAEKLANIALVDPKRAKRMLANRQSAARSKERRMQYMVELERKVQALQIEATFLTTQISLAQKDTIELMAENSALKLKLQSIEQQIHFQDALNDSPEEEIERLRITTGQMSSNFGAMTNHEEPPFQEMQHLYYHNQALQPLNSEQELQILPQHLFMLQDHQSQLQKLVYMQHEHQEPIDQRMKGPMTWQSKSDEGR